MAGTRGVARGAGGGVRNPMHDLPICKRRTIRTAGLIAGLIGLVVALLLQPFVEHLT
jgi:hypothetical protein